jgi:hypothetical protein
VAPHASAHFVFRPCQRVYARRNAQQLARFGTPLQLARHGCIGICEEHFARDLSRGGYRSHGPRVEMLFIDY